ncbi:SDR family NAD(P)-dependent oxidoreductase [Roseibium polysiphoniae]|uniref:SDR family NAD(P)-dependent oxidoreductase n=1 Tax=Roseibium polysiphoniae TaxID=2571221 RepID=A0A944CHY5_9HYPH|nr:SDR family NAD(P)-dependent oxidoreductase [Roseibium polysiphoniae]MBS8262636.1 SDR family NAD(P)-dependent oxidoreductase [Roseibium polysiphoniae]
MWGFDLTDRLAVVIGSSGGIGNALLQTLTREGGYDRVIGLSRSSDPSIELTDAGTIEAAAGWLGQQAGEPCLVIDATGALTLDGHRPEKSWRDLDPAAMARSYAINAIGPALIMKSFLPLLSRDQRSVFATLSARVGSISDNHLGGWYSYRAAKAGLNQIVRSASIELARKNNAAVCVALHPGTVRTPLTESFAKSGLEVQSPEVAAERLLQVIGGLKPEQSGGFFDHQGVSIPF